jgi:hypothetical protein
MRRSIGRTVRQVGLAALIALGSLAAGACDDNVSTNAPTTPTLPTAPTTTETFSGTLTINGAATHVFASTIAGTVTAQVTAVDPSASQVFGLSLGTWNGSSCQVVIANDAATLNAIATGQVTAATNLCARVYDVGKLSASLAYTITAVHP